MNGKGPSVSQQQKEIYESKYSHVGPLAVDHEYPLSIGERQIRRYFRRLFMAQDVLETGCGVGPFARKYAHLMKSYVGIDIAIEGVQRAYMFFGGNRIQFMVANAESSFPYKRESFDVVVVIALIEHLADPVQFVSECSRVLRSSGKLIIQTPNPENLLTIDWILKTVAPRYDAKRHAAAGHAYERFLSPQDLDEMLQPHGIFRERVIYTDTFVKWLWGQWLYPKLLHRAKSGSASETGNEVSNPILQRPPQGARRLRLIRFYNRWLLPLLETVALADKLWEHFGQSGGYWYIGYRTKLSAPGKRS